MKNLLLLICLFSSSILFAQDTTQTKYDKELIVLRKQLAQCHKQYNVGTTISIVGLAAIGGSFILPGEAIKKSRLSYL